MYTTAVLCFIYYIVLLFYTKKWASTFALFWPIAGGAHLAGALIPWDRGWQRGLTAVLILGWILFILVEVLICSAMMKNITEEVPFIIILGAQVRGTSITHSLKCRLETAILYLNTYLAAKVIVSGGQGKGEDVTEAYAMSAYLKEQGIDSTRIYVEDVSTSTWENLNNSGKIIGDKTQPAAVVTSGFHLYRALVIGKRIGFSNLQGIAAPCAPILIINYMVREFFALLYTFKALK